MRERTQPVCKGVNAKGELVWGVIPMPLWQQAMFPVKYCGDFLIFWWKKAEGMDDDDDLPNLSFREWRHLRKKPARTGD